MAKNNEPGFVYIASNPDIPYLKIGHTKRDPDFRLMKLSASPGIPKPFELEYAARVNRCRNIEGEIHRLFDHCKHAKEFYDISVEDAKIALETQFGGIDSERYWDKTCAPAYSRTG